ncbi:2-dehydropantoate 2-reductase [Ferrovibrio sp.]|uniref:2-dehydropantoate 2-reductase n=1 Tax=Ferrovibrio sp. TaxID=1917215 RepID=UPI003D122D95
MKIAIIGAGAIGGYIGGMLARAGFDVSLLARGAHLAAIQAKGLTVEIPGEDGGIDRFTVNPKASDDPAKLGSQDALLITVKAPALPDLAPRLKPMIGPDTAWVTAMNGIPYWYFYRQGGTHDGKQLLSCDPAGTLWRDLPPERAIGGVLWLPASVPEPGLIRRGRGNRLSLGEPDGSNSARVQAIAAALAKAGLEAPLRGDIRQEIWHKLWGNLSFSPLAVLTLSTLGQLAADPATRGVARAMMVEAQAVAEALGVQLPGSVEERIDHSAAIGAHKPSMLQDLEAHRPMEIESITGVISELGRMTGLATPTIDLVLALARRRAAVN